ncbi:MULTISPECIES: type VI secretion system tip protein TssI/VgrG [Caballeronia]|uniref:type VI secretion system tip protein TssI/VgrG n=1 Tax=Caballeronia TaxID=1827195 RepID=UPI001FD61E79|nr:MULTISPECIES: type VI secretion system tip protein TssI/VgrG [Caballeronia]MDR5799180.1 type VI secretion system tip protein TssI/VgrG [Caballeronia sp. LZ001]
MNALSDKVLANRRFDFRSAAQDDGKFAVVEMEGFEAISQPFRFTLTLVSEDPSIDSDAMLKHPATFLIYPPDGRDSVPYHGVLAEFDQLHRADGYVFYRAVLVPRLWRLSLYRISEVYLDEQPIPATLERVLKDSQFTDSDYAFRLSGDFERNGAYRPRSFVCQYEETHLDFLSRWLENEGMYYYFDHDAGGQLIVVDDRVMHDANAVQVDYRPDDEMDTGVSGRSVRDFVSRQKPLPKEVILQEFNHRKAAVPLKIVETVSGDGLGQVMLYGENFRGESEGRRYAKVRAQALVCQGRVFSGEATAVGLRSGFFARLAGHYRQDFNDTYLVTEIHHRGTQAGALLAGESGASGATSYRNSFRAIPANVQFRPPRTTSKPRVAGTMTAFIDSEGSGQYAELDEFGQYKVQLPFDLTDKNPNKGSARVRMATPYAGSDHGMHFPLHKGAEVLLSFSDGDPDRPVIVGAVPNSENPSVVEQASAHENRISTAGGNMLHMGDSEGKEVMWLHSPFHNSTIGLGSIDPKGGGSIWSSTAGNSETVTLGTTNATSVGGKNTLTVGAATTLSAAVNNNATLGATLAMSAGMSVTWNGVFAGLPNAAVVGGIAGAAAGGAGMGAIAATSDSGSSVAPSAVAGAAVGGLIGAAAGAAGVGSWLSPSVQSLTIDDSTGITLNQKQNQRAVDKVTLSGGQLSVVKETVNKVKLGVKIAASTALAAQAALAIASTYKAYQSDGAKAGAWTPNTTGLLDAQYALAGAEALGVYGFMQYAARSLATTLNTEVAYVSNATLDSSGVNLSVGVAGAGAKLAMSTPDSGANASVDMTVGLAGSLAKLSMSAAGIAMNTPTKFGATGGDVAITGVATATIKAPAVTVEAAGSLSLKAVADASLSAGKSVSLDAVTDVEINAAGKAVLRGLGPTTVSGATVLLYADAWVACTGKLIQLG